VLWYEFSMVKNMIKKILNHIIGKRFEYLKVIGERGDWDFDNENNRK